MKENEILLGIDKAVAEARYGAYALLDVNETVAERLEAALRQASKLIEVRTKAIGRRKSRTFVGHSAQKLRPLSRKR